MRENGSMTRRGAEQENARTSRVLDWNFDRCSSKRGAVAEVERSSGPEPHVDPVPVRAEHRRCAHVVGDGPVVERHQHPGPEDLGGEPHVLGAREVPHDPNCALEKHTVKRKPVAW